MRANNFSHTETVLGNLGLPCTITEPRRKTIKDKIVNPSDL
jgi:hypothetical protein